MGNSVTKQRLGTDRVVRGKAGEMLGERRGYMIQEVLKVHFTKLSMDTR